MELEDGSKEEKRLEGINWRGRGPKMSRSAIGERRMRRRRRQRREEEEAEDKKKKKWKKKKWKKKKKSKFY